MILDSRCLFGFNNAERELLREQQAEIHFSEISS